MMVIIEGGKATMSAADFHALEHEAKRWRFMTQAMAFEGPKRSFMDELLEQPVGDEVSDAEAVQMLTAKIDEGIEKFGV